jgi:hypothetical protein
LESNCLSFNLKGLMFLFFIGISGNILKKNLD